jgi:hypothetical protein
MLKISEIGFSTELIGYIPYLEELSKLPHLDPLFSDKKVDMETCHYNHLKKIKLEGTEAF